MKGLIVYKGKYNATRQYAEWLAAELNVPADTSDNISTDQLKDFDYLVLGSSVYMGKLLIKKWLKNNLPAVLKKKIFLFVVCGTPANRKIKLQTYIEASVPAEIRNRCEIFFLPGRMIWEALSGWDRFLMRMGALLEKEVEVKKEMRMNYDGVKKENLSELITAIRKAAVVKGEELKKAS